MKLDSVFSLAIFLLLISSTYADEKEQIDKGGVLVVDGEMMSDLVSKHAKVVALFTDQKCEYCQEFSETYAMLSRVHSHNISYLKIEFNATNAPIFERYGIEDAPILIGFSAGQPISHRFDCFGSGNSVMMHLFKWVQRIYGQIPEWSGEDDYAHQLIVDCSDDKIRRMWENIHKVELWLDIYCGRESDLNKNIAVVTENGKNKENWHLERHNFEQLQSKIRKMIRGYKYKYVLNWNYGIAQQVFVKKQNAFVLIANNESISRQVNSYFQDVKQKWYEKPEKYEPLIFAVSDLSKKTQETIRLKRYLTGFGTTNIYTYYYPLLAYIHHESDGRVSKYVFDLEVDKTKENIENFIEEVHDHIILKKAYLPEEETIDKWKVEEEDNQPTKVQKGQQKSKSKVQLIRTEEEWKTLLNPEIFRSPFFVFFTWRNNYKLQLIESNFSKYWQGELNSTQIEWPSKKVNMMLHQMFSIELPDRSDMVFQYLPTLVHFDREKKITKLEGVTDINKMKEFIREHVKKHVKEYQNEE